MKKHLIATALGLVLAAPACSAGADEGEAGKPLTREDCRAAPGDNGDPSEMQDETGDQANLSDKLDRCDGVLVPPKTGDTEMTAPAPDSGETPIIPPGQVPQQAPKD